MQNIFASLVEFVTRESRSLFAIVIFVGIIYIWGKLSEKESYYRWLVKISPKNAGAHYSLGHFLEKLPNREAEAEKEFQQAIALRPGNAWAYYALYYLQAREKKFEEAQKTLHQMAEKFQKDGVTFACQGNFHWRQKSFEEAEVAYKKAVMLTPNYYYIRYEYGGFLIERLRFVEAESELRMALKFEPSDADTYTSLGDLFQSTKRFTEAENTYKKAIKLAPKEDRAYYALWNLFKNQGQLSNAEEYFKKAILGRIGNPVAYRFIVLSLWLQKKLEEAEKYAQKLGELNPDDITILLVHGHIFDDLNQDDEAERIYRRAIDKYPNDPNPYFHLGRILEKTNRPEDAAGFYEKAHSIDPKDKDFTEYLVKLMRKNKRYEEALNLLYESLEHDPENYITPLSIASIKKLTGEGRDIEEYLESSRVLIPKDENYWYNSACLECIFDNFDLAFEHLQKAAQSEKFDSAWAWEDPDLQWIRDDPRFIEIVGPKPEK